LVRLFGSRLKLYGWAYLAALIAFALFLSREPSLILTNLGVLVFLVVATMLASVKFSKDLERSTNAQIAALQEISRQEIDAAQRRAENSMEVLKRASDLQLRSLSDQFDQMSSVLASQGRDAAASMAEARRLVEEQRQAREREDARFQEERREREAQASRRYPKLSVGIGERPIALPIYGLVHDFWLAVRVEAPIRTLRVLARSFSSTRNLAGPWLRAARSDLVPPHETWLLKIGGLGVRGVHDSVEIRVEAVNAENERFIASWVWPLQATGWTDVRFERMG